MSANPKQEAAAGSSRAAGKPSIASRALEWLWQHFSDVSHPQILDCGSVRQATVDVLLRRGSKLYLADLLTPLQRADPALWDRSGKHPVFLLEEFLHHLPDIPPESLSAIFCWHLLDLVPHDALPPLVTRLCSLLGPGGVLYGFLREPYLTRGAETAWWLESLTTLANTGEGTAPFPCPALTNREIERLLPTESVKTFLTRAGRREVLAVK
jgi:hypothetical protein